LAARGEWERGRGGGRLERDWDRDWRRDSAEDWRRDSGETEGEAHTEAEHRLREIWRGQGRER